MNEFTYRFLLWGGLLWLALGLTVFLGVVEGFRQSIKRGEAAAFSLGALLVVAGSFVALRADMSPGEVLGIEDSAEYALAAEEFVNSGNYTISLQGKEHPPRFSPTFSVLYLAPILSLKQILGGESSPVSSMTAVRITGIAGLLAAFLCGVLVSGVAEGVFLAAIVLLLPDYRYLGTRVMSDVPFVASTFIALLGCLLLKRENEKMFSWLLLGLVVAGVAATRPLGMIVIAPVVLFSVIRFRDLQCSGAARWKRFFLLILPIAVVLLTVMAYQASYFGGPFRSGYHYWMSVPYDFPELVFSLSYVLPNLRVALEQTALTPFLLASIAIVIIGIQKGVLRAWIRGSGQVLFLFAILAGGGVFVFHLLYFYSSTRFFLLSMTLLAAVLVSLAIQVLRQFYAENILRRVALISFLSLVAVVGIMGPPVGSPFQADLRELREALPDNAILVSDQNPLLLERYLREGSSRVVLPFSREAPYASKITMPSPPTPLKEEPSNWNEHRFQPLLAAGASEVFHEVVSENPGILLNYVRLNYPVYVDQELLLDGKLPEVLRDYVSVVGAGGVVRLSLPQGNSGSRQEE